MALQPTTTAVPVGLLDMTYAQPSAATGYPGGSTLADALAAAYAANPAAFAAPAYSFNVSSNKGNPTGQVSVSENTPIALVNNRTGELVYSGVGVDAAKQIETLAADLTKAGGNKATWSVYTAPAGATDSSQFTQVAYEKPNQSLLGKIADVALPVIGGIFGGPLGAAAGSAASGTAQGRSIEDIAKGAALSGLTSFATSQIPGLGGGGSAAGKTIANTAKDAALSNTAGGLLAGVGPIAAPLTSAQIASLTSDILLPSIGGAVGGASSAFTDAFGNNVIYATGTLPTAATSGIGAGIGAGLANVANNFIDPVTGENVMYATQQAPEVQTPDTTLPVPDFSGVGPIAQPLTPEQIANATTGGTGTPGIGTTGGTPATTTQPSTLDDILKYIGIGTTVGGGILDLVKGGIRTGATGTATPYTSLLGPAPNLGRGALTPFTGDYEKYAFGPEWNFFGGQQPA